jgi:hypothetical protein
MEQVVKRIAKPRNLPANVLRGRMEQLEEFQMMAPEIFSISSGCSVPQVPRLWNWVSQTPLRKTFLPPESFFPSSPVPFYGRFHLT